MPKHSVKISLFIATLALASNMATVSPAQQPVNDTIIAVVNKDVITLKDLHEFLSALYVQLRSQGLSESAARNEMAGYEETGIDKLIEQKLIVDESIKKELEIRPQTINARIEEITKSYPTEKDFLNAIVSEGLTVTELKKRIENELRVKYMIDLEIKRRVFVNPSEVTEYYQAHQSDFLKPERADLDSVFIPFQNTDVKTAERKAREAWELVKKGGDFAEVAKKYSIMPSVGIIGKGQMLPVIENTVFTLKEGEISEPVKTDSGIFIFKLKSRLPPETASLDEAKSEISAIIYRQKFQKQFNHWLSNLRKKAYVEIKE